MKDNSEMNASTLVIDTETTGLGGAPGDRVLEIGICELSSAGEVRPIYSEIIRYPDMRGFADAYEQEHGAIWVYSHTDLSVESNLDAPKGLDVVVREVRDIVRGRTVTSYNVPFDFGRFLSRRPWDLQEVCRIGPDIMDLATAEVRDLAESDSIPDKGLQNRLLDDWRGFPDKWVRSLDAYRVLCPDDPAGRDGIQSHRALDDAVQEAHILKALRSMEGRL